MRVRPGMNDGDTRYADRVLCDIGNLVQARCGQAEIANFLFQSRFRVGRITVGFHDERTGVKKLVADLEIVLGREHLHVL